MGQRLTESRAVVGFGTGVRVMVRDNMMEQPSRAHWERDGGEQGTGGGYEAPTSKAVGINPATHLRHLSK